MSWKRLLADGGVLPQKASKTELDRLRGAIERNLRDAALPDLSADNKFGMAYEAALLTAKMAVAVAGYRVVRRRTPPRSWRSGWRWGLRPGSAPTISIVVGESATLSATSIPALPRTPRRRRFWKPRRSSGPRWKTGSRPADPIWELERLATARRRWQRFRKPLLCPSELRGHNELRAPLHFAATVAATVSAVSASRSSSVSPARSVPTRGPLVAQ